MAVWFEVQFQQQPPRESLTDRSRGRDLVTPPGPSIHTGVPRVAQPDTVASQTGGRKYSMNGISGAAS